MRKRVRVRSGGGRGGREKEDREERRERTERNEEKDRIRKGVKNEINGKKKL